MSERYAVSGAASGIGRALVDDLRAHGQGELVRRVGRHQGGHLEAARVDGHPQQTRAGGHGGHGSAQAIAWAGRWGLAARHLQGDVPGLHAQADPLPRGRSGERNEERVGFADFRDSRLIVCHKKLDNHPRT